MDASRGSGGLIYLNVNVNGLTQQLLLDTGANFCVASETFARLHKISLLPDQLSVTSATGQVVSMRVGLADTVQVGRMAFHHVVFGVCPDKALIMPTLGVTMDALLGLPVIIALEHIRVSADGSSVEVGPASLLTPAPASARNVAVACNCLFPLVRLQYGDDKVPFVLDTGANQTILYSRFATRFPQVLAGSTEQKEYQNELGGRTVTTMRVPARTELVVGNVPVVMHDVSVSAENEASGPAVFGLAGANLLTSGFELDFRRMELSLAPPSNE